MVELLAVPRVTTAAEFEAYALHPDRAARRLEWHSGRMVEVVSGRKSSRYAARLVRILGNFIEAHGLGEITGADGGYVVGEDRYIPDVGFVAAGRLVATDAAYYPVAPDLAVEVLSPTDRAGEVRLKLTNYLAAGVVVWLVDVEAQTVEVHTPGQPSQRWEMGQTLPGGAVLPGFSVAVDELFS
jgi:Uma2 family endonuclease